MRIILVCLMVCLWGCSKNSNRKQIIGTWEIDSVYTYYNRFDQSLGKSDDRPVYSYGKNGIMHEIKGELGEKSFFYEFIGNDSLFIHPTSSGNEAYYEIIRLNRNIMVLKKNKKPVFPGGDQHRYEIRYFSKIGGPKETEVKFEDPRNVSGN